MKINKIFPILSSAALVLIVACSPVTRRILPEPKKTGLPGIDPAVYSMADSITEHLFVSYPRRLKAVELTNIAGSDVLVADTLWNLINQSKPPVYPDSVDKASKKGQYLLEQIREDSLNRSMIKFMSYVMLNDAIESFQNVEEVDPFNLKTRALLADAYFGRGEKKFSEADLRKAVQTLEAIIEKNKGDHELYEQLGNTQRQLNEWQNAYNSYKRAYEVMLATAFLNVKSTSASDSTIGATRDSVDNDWVLRYHLRLAESQSRLYDAKAALQLFDQAVKYARTKDDSTNIKNWVDWILWDDGNIAASELRDSVVAKERIEKFDVAYKGYLDLLEQVRTEKAKKWIQNRLAQFEFYILDDKEKGAQRLLKLISSIPVDPDTEMPVDSTDRKYFEECGEMYFRLALFFKDKADYNKAKDAFATSAQIPWASRGKCYLELARLNLHNHEAVIQYVEKALESDYHFKKEEMIILLNLKLRVLRQKGPRYQEEARKLLDQIKNLQSSGA